MQLIRVAWLHKATTIMPYLMRHHRITSTSDSRPCTLTSSKFGGHKLGRLASLCKNSAISLSYEREGAEKGNENESSLSRALGFTASHSNLISILIAPASKSFIRFALRLSLFAHQELAAGLIQSCPVCVCVTSYLDLGASQRERSGDPER